MKKYRLSQKKNKVSASRESIEGNLKSLDIRFPNLNKEWKVKYDELILLAVDEDRGINYLKDHGKYFNIHHIIPRGIGGDDEHYNLIKLKHSEHLLAHRYLFLMLEKTVYGKECQAMAGAYIYMSQHGKIECPDEYARLRKMIAERMKEVASTPRTEESRKKQSDRMKNLSTEDHPRYGEKIDIESNQYTSLIKRLSENNPTDKSVIGIFNGIDYFFKSRIIAIRKTGIPQHSLGDCIKGILESRLGWSFRHAIDSDDYLKDKEYSKDHWDSIKSKIKFNKSQCKSIINIDPDGNYIFFTSQLEVMEKTGFGKKTISECISGKRKEYQGHRFMLATNKEREEERYIESEDRSIMEKKEVIKKMKTKKYSSMKRIKK